MKSFIKKLFLLGTFVATLVGQSQSTCSAQERYDAAETLSNALSSDDAKRDQNARAIELYKKQLLASNHPQVAPWQAIQTATAELRNAPDDAAKAAARKKLVDLLANYFDADMKNRQAQLQTIEERVKKLRAQIDKRASKKQEIIELQVKLVENEADGLGFFGSPSGSAPMMGSPYELPMNGGAGPGQPGMMGGFFEGGRVGPPMLLNPSTLGPEGGLPATPGAMDGAAQPRRGGPVTTTFGAPTLIPAKSAPAEATEAAPNK